MRKILVWLIRLYQRVPGNFHNNCKFEPTCSNYAIDAIKKYGSIKGSYLAVKRIIKCRPGSQGGYDPVK